MRQLLVAGVALLVVQGALGYGAVRRRQKQPYLPPPSPPQDTNILSTQYYPASHNCSSLQNFRSTDVHQVHHSQREQPHTHVTHHVTPVVRTHVHHQPPVEVLRTTKTVYQPPDVLHRTVDYEHHDHVTTHYPGRTHTHTDYYPGKVTRTHTQSVDEKIVANRKAIEVHHDDGHLDHHQQQQHHQHHDSHAHFGRVPTGNAVVTSYFNFPGSGRSDSAFQAPAPNRKVDYRPSRTHHSPAYSPLQAQSIEDGDDDDRPVRQPAPAAAPRPPIYERISPPANAPASNLPYYTGQASESKGPTVFPPPPSTRPSDEVRPQRYPTTSFAGPSRKRPEPLQLKEKESDQSEDSRDLKVVTNDDSENPKNRNPVFLKSSPRSSPLSAEFARQRVQNFDTQTNQQLQNANGQIQQGANKLSQDLDNASKGFTRPSVDPFNRRPSVRMEQNNSEQDLRSATQEQPDFARPLRYSHEQVPTASLRYHNS